MLLDTKYLFAASNVRARGSNQGSIQSERVFGRYEPEPRSSAGENNHEESDTLSRGNVFLDLGFDREEAAHLEVRSALMFTIRKLIQDQGLTQAKAAKLLGVTQPRISDLVRGRIDLFSIDSLVDMLARAGIKVAVKCSPRPRRPAA